MKCRNMRVNKTFLLSYEREVFQSHNSQGLTYKLKVETKWLWGLFTTKKIMSYCIPWCHDYQKYFDHWDNMIKNKTQIGLRA